MGTLAAGDGSVVACLLPSAVVLRAKRTAESHSTRAFPRVSSPEGTPWEAVPPVLPPLSPAATNNWSMFPKGFSHRHLAPHECPVSKAGISGTRSTIGAEVSKEAAVGFRALTAGGSQQGSPANFKESWDAVHPSTMVLLGMGCAIYKCTSSLPRLPKTYSLSFPGLFSKALPWTLKH